MHRGIRPDPIKNKLRFGEIDPMVLTRSAALAANTHVEIMDRGGAEFIGGGTQVRGRVGNQLDKGGQRRGIEQTLVANLAAIGKYGSARAQFNPRHSCAVTGWPLERAGQRPRQFADTSIPGIDESGAVTQRLTGETQRPLEHVL